MTTQQKSNGNGRQESAEARASSLARADTLAKSYRYVRLAMVGLLTCVALAVLYQTWRQGWDFLESVSGYYYTPAQAFFVGGLIGLGACMIALKGTTPVEDVALNIGGVFAVVVAIVPTARNADHRAAVRACEEGTPLLTGPDCPTVQALEDANTANVDNSVFALLVVGAIALLLGLVLAWSDGTLNPRESSGGSKKRKAFLWGFGVTLAIWLAALIARLVSLPWVIEKGHWIATIFLFVCVLVVVVANARRVERARSDGVAPPSAAKGSMEAARGLVSARAGRDSYTWIARATLLVAVVTLALWAFTDFPLFWVEAPVFLLFLAFWAWQTFELESSANPAR